jgi:hypothetical protein
MLPKTAFRGGFFTPEDYLCECKVAYNLLNLWNKIWCELRRVSKISPGAEAGCFEPDGEKRTEKSPEAPCMLARTRLASYGQKGK